jgi:hypothetical protein
VGLGAADDVFEGKDELLECHAEPT